MNKNRLEAFSDGVLAIIITIMVLELKVPHHAGEAGHDASPYDLLKLWPVFLSYVLSFMYLGIYWSNHHHLLHTVHRVSGGILWANLHLLFWLSLVPFTTAWMGENEFAPWPTALYGVVLFCCALAWLILQGRIIRVEGPDSHLAKAVGRDWKGKVSQILYVVAIPLAFVHPALAGGLYLAVALMWIIPDRRIERALREDKDQGS